METLAGRNSVREALVAGRRRFQRVTLADGVSEQGLIGEILDLCRPGSIPVSRSARRDLDRLADDLTHQGSSLRFQRTRMWTWPRSWPMHGRRARSPLLLVLDELQDPQNVGALLRTAEAVGVHGVIIASASRRADHAGRQPRLGGRSGAPAHLRRQQHRQDAARASKSEGLWIAGVEDHPDAQDYRQADLNRPLALVLGSEGQGMRRLVAKQCDYVLRIPMRGRINSLNVSVAGAIMLYEAFAHETAQRIAYDPLSSA